MESGSPDGAEADDASGGDGLADVTLGVFGEVDQEAEDGGGQGLAADEARQFQQVGAQGNDGLLGGVEMMMEFGEELFGGGSGVELGMEGVELPGGELLALEIGGEAIDAAADVADVEADGSEASGPGPKFERSEWSGGLGEIFSRHLEGIEERSGEGGDTGERSAEPGLGQGHRLIIAADTLKLHGKSMAI